MTRAGDALRATVRRDLIDVDDPGTPAVEDEAPRTFAGRIDEVRIYDRPLNDSEIDSLYRVHEAAVLGPIPCP